MENSGSQSMGSKVQWIADIVLPTSKDDSLFSCQQTKCGFLINTTFYRTKKGPCIHVRSIHSARHLSKHPHHQTSTEAYGHMSNIQALFEGIHRLETRTQAFSNFHGPESTIQAHLLPRLADEKIPGFDLAWQAPAERQQGNLSQPFLPSKRDECQRVTGAVSCQFAVGQTLDQ